MESVRDRLRVQLEALEAILGGGTEASLRLRPGGKWSAIENLAHVARHQEVFVERLERMRSGTRVPFAAYKAEDDAEWPAWMSLATEEVIHRLRTGREALVAQISMLSPEQWKHTGIHPRLGELTVGQWLHFFELHSAHHLFIALKRARGVE